MKRLVITGCAAALLLIGLVFLTDPQDVPSLLLILPFVLISILLFTCIRVILYFFGVAASKSRHIALVAALVPVLIMGLQSIGQLTIRDVAVIGAITALSYFYVLRLSGWQPRGS